jgi:tyrosine-protein kinase Etk/Wzc
MSQSAEQHEVSGEQLPRPFQPDTVNLLDYLEVVARHKGAIVGTSMAALVLSAAVSLCLPNLYSSTALILPPQQQNSGALEMIMGQMPGGMSSLAGDLLGKGSPADQFVGILNSNAISDRIIDRFKLMQVYDKKYRIDTYKSLGQKVDIAVGKKDGIISITVEDRDPKRAAEIANAYVEELDNLSARLTMTDAGNDGVFLETRLAKAKGDLARAEEALKQFQTKTKAVDVTEQAKGTIKGVADLEGQLAVEEVKLGGMRRVFTDGSQDIKNQQAVIANLRGQIAKFQGTRGADAIPGMGSVPELGEQYLRLMREFKIQEALVEFLTKQYEVTKLSQAKNTAGIQVIQKARVPDKKAKPKRSVIVLAATFAGFMLALLYAFLREAGARISSGDRERLLRIRQDLLSGRGSGMRKNRGGSQSV